MVECPFLFCKLAFDEPGGLLGVVECLFAFSVAPLGFGEFFFDGFYAACRGLFGTGYFADEVSDGFVLLEDAQKGDSDVFCAGFVFVFDGVGDGVSDPGGWFDAFALCPGVDFVGEGFGYSD